MEEDESEVVVFLASVAIDQVRLSLENEFFLNIQAFVVKEEWAVGLDFVYQMIQIQTAIVFVQELVLMATKNNLYLSINQNSISYRKIIRRNCSKISIEPILPSFSYIRTMNFI
jgi:hypothetical protein